jgi:hypothetical protein
MNPSMSSVNHTAQIAEVLRLLGGIEAPNDEIRSRLDKVKVDLVDCLAMAGQAPVSKDASSEPSPAPNPAQDFTGLSKSEAVVEILRQSTGPMSQADLNRALVERNVISEQSESANSSLAKALSRRAQQTGDVLRVDRGKWDLASRYTKEQIIGMVTALGSSQDVATALQRERTKAGLERARRRGKKIGAKLKLNKEQAAEFKRMLEMGCGRTAVCSALNLTAASYYNYRKRLKNWNPEDPWPPKEEDDEQEASSKERSSFPRLVKT